MTSLSTLSLLFSEAWSEGGKRRVRDTEVWEYRKS